MKLRHVRAVAVFGIAVFALTGARGSSGGSCDNSSSGSSSSSSTGGSSYGDDTTSGSSTTTGGTTGSTSSGTTTGSVSGTGSNNKAIRDVRIDSCEYDPSRGIVAAISATNSSTSENYTYTFTVSFTDPSGTSIGERNPTIPMVLPGRTDKLDVATPYTPQDGATSGGKCTLSKVQRVIS
ncbi:hypothetical protein [Streptomyces spiramyceticus]|uniref:hypothetical protein n=1 Tax=Streptomyces spiramyceticus TaxID=299717 RepID=UPI00237B4B84|nr:hypothetical protein [Streptomyces spiramyceticus]